ncbi:MAG: ATP-dependent helicase [Candidatus Hodarchaeota archaeon]
MGKKKTFEMKPPPVKISAKYKDNLNEEQIKAVVHDKGPAIVIAGAGSGKTRVLTYRVAWLIENNVQPQNIMLVTFTKKAAQEMISRVEKLVNISKNKLVAGTFHSVANRFLRKYARYIDFESNFSILDRSDSRQVMKSLLGSLLNKKEKTDKKRYPAPSTMVDIYSRAMNLHLQVNEVLNEFYPQYLDLKPDIEVLLQHYFEAKKKSNSMDFDDLLVYFLRLLRTDGVKERICSQVKHLLVDEYQDVNQIQADIVWELGSTAKSVVVVGDDAQSIYSFRGASVKHMLDFGKFFEGVKKYFLTINYRSTPQILDLSNSSIKHNKDQFPKELVATVDDGELPEVVPCEDNDEESHFICQKILEARENGIPFEEQAVLVRAKFQSLNLEQKFLQYKIPYVVRMGARFYEAAHIKDLLSFGLVIINPRNEVAWTRILTLLPGMGPGSARKVIDYVMDTSNPLLTFSKENFKAILMGKRIKTVTFQNMAKLQDLYKKLVLDPSSKELLPEDKLLPLPELFSKLVDFYEPYLKDKYENANDRYLDLKEFIILCGKYESLSDLLAEVAISETFLGEEKTGSVEQDDERPLVLSTIHQAKGLEWENVYVIEAADTLFPHSLSMNSKKEIEEERRLFYVAATRAKENLFLTYPQTRYMGNRRVILCKSLFLDEIEADNVYQEVNLKYGTSRFEDYF